MRPYGTLDYFCNVFYKHTAPDGQIRTTVGVPVVRSALHNAVMAAIFFTKTDNVFKKMYVRLTKELHKAHNVAVMAVAHKMLKIAHTLLKNGTKW